QSIALYRHHRGGEPGAFRAWRRVRADSGRRRAVELLDLLGALVCRQCAPEPHDRSGLSHLVRQWHELVAMDTLSPAYRAGDPRRASSWYLRHGGTDRRLGHQRLSSRAAFFAASIRFLGGRSVRRKGSEWRDPRRDGRSHVSTVALVGSGVWW